MMKKMKRLWVRVRNDKEERQKVIVILLTGCAAVVSLGLFLWHYFTPEPNPNLVLNNEEEEENNDRN